MKDGTADHGGSTASLAAREGPSAGDLAGVVKDYAQDSPSCVPQSMGEEPGLLQDKEGPAAAPSGVLSGMVFDLVTHAPRCTRNALLQGLESRRVSRILRGLGSVIARCSIRLGVI